MKLSIVAALSFGLSISACASASDKKEVELVSNAEIIEISSSAHRKAEMIIYVKVKGGSGICANKTLAFPLTIMNSDLMYTLMHTTIIEAYKTNSKVTIFSGEEAKCEFATKVSMAKS